MTDERYITLTERYDQISSASIRAAEHRTEMDSKSLANSIKALVDLAEYWHATACKLRIENRSLRNQIGAAEDD